jgi:epoxyqueuosine reductase
MHDGPALRQLLQSQAAALGFQHLRVAAVPPDAAPRASEFAAWLARGDHGELRYLETSAEERMYPLRRLPTARSVVVLGLEHHHRRPPDPGGLTGLVARYAWGRDYHNLVGKRLLKLMAGLRRLGFTCYGGVDTAPVLERAWAELAGLGYSGKNNVQIFPARGSWMLLGAFVTDAELPPDAPLGDHCGRCTRCLSACPTDAFVGPHHLDARRCVAYWTIEARDAVPEALRAGMGRWVFGCDVCQEVCPHNTAAPDSIEDDLLPKNAYLDLPELLMADDQALLDRFLGTPLRRAAPFKLKRNALTALGNLGDPSAIPAVRPYADSSDLVLREHARWALARLGE